MKQRRQTVRSRRETFLWRVLQVGVALLAIAVVASILTACGDDDDGADPTATATGATPTVRPSSAETPTVEVPLVLADGTALGEPDAPLTLAVFEDFQCPNCLVFTLAVEPFLVEEYVATGKMRLEFHNFPILGDESVIAAVGGVCANEQDKFWEFHNKLFQVQVEAGQLQDEQLNVGRFSPNNLVAYAEDLGMNAADFQACLESEEALEAVRTDFETAQDAGLRGTPGFILNGEPIGYPASEQEWRQVLDARLSAPPSRDTELEAKLVAAKAAFPFDLAKGNTVGSEDAPVKVVVFEDLQCPFCLRYTAEVEPLLIEEFVKTGKMQLTFKNLPILGTTESTLAAVALTCAGAQEKFWEYHNLLFTVQAAAGQASDEKIDVGRFARGKLRSYAEDVGLDAAQWDECMDDPASLDRVRNEAREASSLGIRSTPSFVVNGRPAGAGAPTIESWREIVAQVTAE